MEEKYDVEMYFKNRGYKIIIPKESSINPKYIVEKDGIEKTVDIIYFNDRIKSVSQSVYDRIVLGGFFVIIPPFDIFNTHELQVFTKDDIKDIVKTYSIWWNEKDKVK